MSVVSAKKRKPIKKYAPVVGVVCDAERAAVATAASGTPPSDAIAPSEGTPPAPMAVARALRHGGHVACPMMLAAQAPAPATATASSSLQSEGRNGG